MKIKEYFHLARRALKQRKKTSASTVKGLSIGFILLIPLVVALFGFNFSINKQLNKTPYLLYAHVLMSDYRIPMENISDRQNRDYTLLGSENLSYFTNNQNISNRIVYERHVLKRGNPTDQSIITINIEDNQQTTTIKGQDQKENYFSVIDTQNSDSYFPKNLVENYPNGIFVENCDQGFTGNGKKQVIIAEKMLKRCGLKPEDVYLKNISISAEKYFFTSSFRGKEDISGYICKNYKVVGIIKEQVSKLYIFSNSYTRQPYMYSDMFFTDVNVYFNGGQSLRPYVKKSFTGIQYIKYDNLEQKDVLNEEYMMFSGYRASVDNFLTLFSTDVYFESNNYAQLERAITNTNIRYENILHSPMDESALYGSLYYTYRYVRAASYALGIVGIVMVLCAIINLYCSIKNSVEQRKFYLTMIRAIGAKDKVIPKLYFAESVITLSKANFFIALVGFALSAGFKLLVDKMLKVYNVNVTFTIPWFIIVICVSAVLIFLYIIGLIFSYGCSYRLSKKPIVNVLKNY